MKHTVTKLFSSIMVLMMAFALTACGSSNKFDNVSETVKKDAVAAAKNYVNTKKAYSSLEFDVYSDYSTLKGACETEEEEDFIYATYYVFSLSVDRLENGGDAKAEKDAFDALKAADDEEKLMDMAKKGKKAFEEDH